ncbi:Phytol kinase [Quillaja saponaria]|uniref:Phytol kinase n=1 Tax=Quillaja saponaria TaxID=32244 RepID=A0AAD7PLC5_QUISA|nr:Phytol kinase [Quillaja saponaria]
MSITVVSFQFDPFLLKHFRPLCQFPPQIVKSSSSSCFGTKIPSPTSPTPISRRNLRSIQAISMLHQNPAVSDIYATALSGVIALSLLRFWEETAKRGLLDQKLNRKLVHLNSLTALHVSIGLAFLLCWPLFSAEGQAPILAALIPGINIIRMLLVGFGLWKDPATVKLMSRFGDYRELLRGPLYYASTITFTSMVYWRTSPISIATICNLCAGDGTVSADIVGRRFGSKKIPYNSNKSIAGSLAMTSAGFLASIEYMYYFSSFGFIQESWEMVLRFFNCVHLLNSGGVSSYQL